MNESLWFCVLHAGLSAFLVWQVFNLQFETLLAASKVLRLSASALLFAAIAGVCVASVKEPLLDEDWPQLVLLVSLAYLIRRFRRLPSRISAASLEQL